MWLPLLLLCAAALSAAPPLIVDQSGFQPGPDGLPPGWKTWAPREEIAPRAFIDTLHSRGKPGALAISGNSKPGACGGWEHLAPVAPGKWYRLAAHYRTEGPLYEPWQVLARLDWVNETGKRAGQPEYAYSVEKLGDWKRVTVQAPAPPDARKVKLQFYLLHAPGATVWWDEISLEEIAAPPPRPVTVAALNFRPLRSPGSPDNTTLFLQAIEKAVPQKTDLILLGEGITVVATGKQPVDVAEPVPGPTTNRLGEVARRRNTYIVAGLYEREDRVVYNIAVLINRAGQVAGKYRKVYLPREEMEGGLTPGSDYPVFQTDFGSVGIMICWDLQYADPARALALRGAEIILVPIWGGNQTLGKARAIENQVFLAASGYDYPTYVLDPDGEIVAQAAGPATAAVATIDLNRRYADKWLGWMRGRFRKELRLDVSVDPSWPLR